MKLKEHISTILLIIVVAGLAFYGGMQYQKSKAPAAGSGFFRAGLGAGRTGANVRFGGGAGGASFRPVSGEVLSQDAKSITVKMQDGSSKIVLLSDKTIISKSTDATMADIKTGERVAVFGTEGTDGIVTAQTIQLNPTARGAMRTGATPAAMTK